jgi:ABC-2 type transport system permease protein
MFQKVNPIILREMRGRMRGWRAFVVLTIFLMLLSCLAGSVYAIVYTESVSYNPYGLTSPSVQYGPIIGKSIFSGTVLLLLMITSFISPAFTAGAIAGEREQKTYEVLLITPMQARQIVSGKLGAVFLFLLRGVALAEVLIAAVGLLVTVFAFGALGLYVSTLARTTMIAIIITYSFVILTYALPLMLFYFGTTLLPPVIEYADQNLLLQVIGVALIYVIAFALSINPLSSALLTAMIAADGRGYFYFKENFDQITFWFVSPWLIYVAFYTLLALLLLFLTIRRVAKISDK